MIAEEPREDIRYLIKERVVGWGGRSCIDHDDQVILRHLLGDHEHIFPCFHLSIRGTQVFSFTATESLQGFLCVLIGEEDHLGTYLTAQTANKTETGDEIMLFLRVRRYSHQNTGDRIDGLMRMIDDRCFGLMIDEVHRLAPVTLGGKVGFTQFTQFTQFLQFVMPVLRHTHHEPGVIGFISL